MNEIPDKKSDLFELADQNAQGITNRFTAIKKKYGIKYKAALEEFVNFVKKSWTLSINLKLSEVNSFLISGKYQNLYQVIEDDLQELNRERGVNISKEEAARNRMGIFYEKRKIFESQFEESERFIYASLNTGGIGLGKYGEFSLIIHQKEANKISSSAFLKKESICYVDNGKVNIEELKHDTANRETVHLLTAIKNEKEIPHTAKKNWPGIVCHEKNYIEAITKDEISTKHISTVRMSKDSYDLYFDYLYKAYSSRLDESEKLHVRMFKDMLKLLAKNGIDKEIVDGQEN